MTTQPEPALWLSDRYKLGSLFPPSNAPDLEAWWRHEMGRSFPLFRRMMEHGARDGVEALRRITYVSAHGQFPAELLRDSEEIRELGWQTIRSALWYKADENQVTLLTKPRFWVWRSRASLMCGDVLDITAACLSAPAVDLELPI